MLRKNGRTEGRTDGIVTISLRNFVGEGIIKGEALLIVGYTIFGNKPYSYKMYA
jgi:hypothetical protein